MTQSIPWSYLGLRTTRINKYKMWVDCVKTEQALLWWNCEGWPLKLLRMVLFFFLLWGSSYFWMRRFQSWAMSPVNKEENRRYWPRRAKVQLYPVGQLHGQVCTHTCVHAHRHTCTCTQTHTSRRRPRKHAPGGRRGRKKMKSKQSFHPRKHIILCKFLL